MKFKKGRYYKNDSGRMYHIVGKLNTTTWGKCLVAEVSDKGQYAQCWLAPIVNGESVAGWRESTRLEWQHCVY